MAFLQLSLDGKPKISRWPYLSGGYSRLLHHSAGREQSLKDSGHTAVIGHESRVKIFERYVEGKTDRVARRLRPSASTSYELQQSRKHITNLISTVLDELSTTGRESLSVDRLEEIGAQVLAPSEPL